MICQRIYNGFCFWPLNPKVLVGAGALAIGILGIIGLIFSLVMLIDCLKRNHEDFGNIFTKDGQFDKIIWAIAIIITALPFYFAGAIVYYFVVKKQK